MKGGESLDLFYYSPSGRANKAHIIFINIVRNISSIFDGLHLRLEFQVAMSCITTRVIHAYPQFQRSFVALYRPCIQSQYCLIVDWSSCSASAVILAQCFGTLSHF